MKIGPIHLCVLLALLTQSPLHSFAEPLPSLEDALNSREDVWGNAALKQSNGPNYDFFAQLLPPLRYVNTDFRYYPIVLSAPAGRCKARLCSNGSGINSRANKSMWHEVGMPVSFFVGSNAVPFGDLPDGPEEPRYLDGWLPIVHIGFHEGGATYLEETFASVTRDLSEHGVLFTKFGLVKSTSGMIRARIETTTPLNWVNHSIRNKEGRVLFWCDENWSWDSAKKTLTAKLTSHRNAWLATATAPLEPNLTQKMDAEFYAKERNGCAGVWESILQRGMQAEVPEKVVNDAYKSVIVGALMLISGDDMNYSAGNAYQCMYEAESGDVTRALFLWGNPNGRATIPPLLDYGIHPGLRFHDASFKLQMLAHYYWLTRDRDFIAAQKSRWSKSADLLIRNIDPHTGLLPRENYCGDQSQKVHSLNANANAWRGLRDMAAVLADIAAWDDAMRIDEAARSLRKATLDAVAKSEFRDTTPPFIPVALFGDEKPFPMLTDSRAGSYWDLMIPYVIGSGIFDSGSERETWTLRYLQEHGGLCMGMIRFDQHSGLFANTNGVDDLYTLRYADALLQRDEPDRVLVSFYGKLAQGMTRNTFISAEGTSLSPQDKFGRAMYLPPVCSGNGLYLWMLRGMLVQDHDADGDGVPDTLRLLFATPRPWLEDGKTIRVENAPTAFGPVSLQVISKLRSGKIEVNVTLPTRNPAEKTLLRLRLPEGWQIKSAANGEGAVPLDAKGDLDLSKLSGEQKIVVRVMNVIR